MKLVTIVGARPQFVKAAAVSRAIQGDRRLVEILVHTGQHYDANMSKVFFAELGIPPPAHLLRVGSGGHGAQTGRILEAVERVLLSEKPECVLVYGDTNSTLAGALAAAKLHIPVAHVEAGLRSFNRAMPEEINRVLTDHVSEWLFAPTTTAVDNLAREGISGDHVMLVGDVMLDAALFHANRSSRVLESLGLSPKSFVLATIHRAENTDDQARLGAIFSAFNLAAAETPLVVPLHPRTRAALALLNWRPGAGLRLIDPIGYLDMVALESSARLIVTDSGGVQKEAFFHRVPCITLRTETEWAELVECGWNTLAPPIGVKQIAQAISRGIRSTPPAAWPVLYGTGDAAGRIVNSLAILLSKQGSKPGTGL